MRRNASTVRDVMIAEGVCLRYSMPRIRFVVCLMCGLSFILLALYIHSTSELSHGDLAALNQDTSVPYSAPYQTGQISSSTHSDNGVISTIHVDNIQVRQRQYARRGHVQTICERNGLGNPATKLEQIDPDDFSRIFVDDKYKILYCEVPKVACTNWKRILLILTGKMNTSEPEKLPPALVHYDYQKKYLRTLDTYKPRQIMAKIRHYYKFMFVRDPLERIVSAYRNKFRTSYNTRYQLRYGRKIIKRYRSNPTEHATTYGNDVRFKEFVQFLLDSRTKHPLDIHWRPYYQICHPCMLQYDFVGKYETLDEDVDFILDELGVKHLLDFPERPNAAVPRTADVLSKVFANISSEQIHNLWKLYSVDFSMFDYPYPDFVDK